MGLAFYLVATLATRLRARNRATPDPRLLLDLVAVGTIADLAPLVEENRILASVGLRELAQGRRPGFRALAERSQLADAVKDAAGLLRIHQIHINGTGIRNGCCDGIFRDFVESDAAGGFGRDIQDFREMP